MLLNSRSFRFLREGVKRPDKCAKDDPFHSRFPTKTYLNREIIGTKAEVVSPTKRRMLRPQVHFHMLEEVMVLAEKNKEFATKRKT